jgi:hypothetical protein
MEILQFIFFTISYNLMTTANFFNTIIIYLFLKLVYKKNNITIINLDPSMIIINFLNILLHLIEYQLILLLNIIKNNEYGNKIINSYNDINMKYITIKNKILQFIIFIPIKLGMLKYTNNEVKSSIQLKSNQDINTFLDGLLDKNK